MKYHRYLGSLLTFILFSSVTIAQESEWTNLFNGQNLNNWEKYGGDAPFEIEGETIIGTCVPERNNTFLCTDRPYGDFVLELEFFLEALLNSGVMVRAQHRKQGDIRRIYGYQMEIDPGPRAYTGGIYDEARRGWIYPLHPFPEARTAFQQGMWNKVRIEAIGQQLRTYINGQPVSNLIDAMDSEGLICLQVHAPWGDNMEGKSVSFRKIRIKENATVADRWKSKALGPVVNLIPNTISEEEARLGWKLLWDGKSSAGWRGAKMDDFPKKGWTINEGVLSVTASDGGESTNGGDIVTIDHYSNFDLQFEFKPSLGANSGVKYFVDPSLNKGAGSAIGLEFQILDDQQHPDAKKGVAGNRTAGSLYDLITAKVLDVPGRGKEIKIGEWNRGRILVRGGQVEHWLNGYKVVEYDRFSQVFSALVNYSKYRDWEGFGTWPAGPILLQDHGDAVDFRSIKIREL
ncbi:hypothetical protein CEQ90_06265 [Lewinellaceae bacterium SD302]|nr:hypothetical protein CEQ90_06265 [Lewinellaceae bacterium SD302]